ncbi:Uncharacterised protein [uncultured archaeon]|nr:Uncharacterised protein [uncultured archaeon]
MCLVSASSGRSQRTTIMSGCSPSSLITFTLCCVGLVFCSPSIVEGASVTCTKKMFPDSSYLSWRMASRKGMDSISPTVPPTSTRQISQPPSRETCLMRLLISSVMCGMICTVLPRYSPLRSFSMTVL